MYRSCGSKRSSPSSGATGRQCCRGSLASSATHATPTLTGSCLSLAGSCGPPVGWGCSTLRPVCSSSGGSCASDGRHGRPTRWTQRASSARRTSSGTGARLPTAYTSAPNHSWPPRRGGSGCRRSGARPSPQLTFGCRPLSTSCSRFVSGHWRSRCGTSSSGSDPCPNSTCRCCFSSSCLGF